MDFDSDSDELAELLKAAADEGEITLNENGSSNVAPIPPVDQQHKENNGTDNGLFSTQAVEKTENASVKLAEEAYDSSDEEDLQNFFERKYNEYGRDINTMLKRSDAARMDSIVGNEVGKNLRQSNFTTRSVPEKSFGQRATTSIKAPVPSKPEKAENIYTDPIFGLRLIQPLISSTALRERMMGRRAVEIRYLQNHLATADLSQDWCISGVIVNKGPVSTSNAGSQYVIWRLSDLKGDMKTVSLFLFKSAYKDLWKTAQGMIIAVLNPQVFSRKDNNGESSLSIDSAQRVMILGRSKDFGICKSKKKNGEPCTAIVNLGVCEFCVYHVKQEYGKMSGRSELQSATSGRGLQSLRNKILGKSEVFYGGKSFVAEPAKPSHKLKVKDQQRLMSLSDTFKSSPLGAATTGKPTYLASTTRTSRIAEAVESNSSQRMKDLERLKSLNVNVSALSASPSIVSKENTNHSQILASKPSLSRESFSFTIGKSPKISNDLAKAKAAAILQKKPIEKSNPNFIKYRGTEAGKKRAHCVLESEEESAQKKQKLAEEVEKFKNERIKQLIAARSSHTDLIEAHEINVKDQYFNKLEKKEAMEEKMINTTKMECKAVICLQCKYKAFSAAQRCKDERHTLKVVDAEKRFFECEDCGNRTVSLFRIPKISCTNCQGSRWKRTGMIKDKSGVKPNQPLSIRGDEEMFLGSVSSGGNINLCVSED